MTPEQFNQDLKRKTEELKRYVMYTFPVQAGNTSLRFINGNFRAQGWQGSSFQRWKPNKRKGTILIKKRKLSNATTFTVKPGETRVYNPMAYAKVHNEGSHKEIIQNVRAHTRKITKLKVVSTVQRKKTTGIKWGRVQTGTTNVRAFTRKMKQNIDQRQFMPIKDGDSPVLDKALGRQVERGIKNIFP